MQFIWPHVGFPFILLADAADVKIGAGIDKLRTAKAAAAIAGNIDFMKSSKKQRGTKYPLRRI
jgi:hypothetical protein